MLIAWMQIRRTKSTKKHEVATVTGHVVSYMNHEILIDEWRCDGSNPYNVVLLPRKQAQ